MSVLIKGIEVPNTCKECIIGNPKNKTCYILGLPKRNLKVREDCPLIEVKDGGENVVIKGMKMPKSCSSCRFMYDSCGEGYYCSLLKKTFDRWDEISVKRGKGCPLV